MPRKELPRGATLDLPADSSTKAFDLPKPDGLTTTYFLKLELHNAAGKLIRDNFYWLSTKPDVLDWGQAKRPVYTPQKEFADLTGLNSLPKAKVTITQVVSRGWGRLHTHHGRREQERWHSVHDPSAGHPR